MTALVTQVADAVVSRIATASMAEPVTVARAYRPEARQDQLAGVRVYVIPSGLAIERESRGVMQYRVVVECVVKCRVARGDEARTADLVGLVEQLAELLWPPLVFESARTHAATVVVDPLIDDAAMDEDGIFTAVVTADYQIWR